MSSITYSIPTLTKTAILTPFNMNNNGARVMFNVEESPVVDMWWDVRIKYQNTWQFIIKADETFAINPNLDSIITFTMNIPEINTKELLFAFTTDNMQYISVAIPMDNIGRANRIFPACSLISKLPIFGVGDISSVPETDRSCDIAGGSCDYWKEILPSNYGFNNVAPITFTFKNSIRTNEIILYYRSESWVSGFTQSCRFAQHFARQSALKIYIAGDDIHETYSVSSFNITSQIQRPTASPTYTPTINPTIQTRSPTQKPSNNPTQIPTINTFNPTRTPSNNPSQIPTNIPTISPSKYPTNNPTKYPTNIPTDNPSPLPSIYPTISPSQYPTYNPTKSPTNKPTDNTLSPTYTPSNYPSISPTQNPTTISPTPYPTYKPTNKPTVRPTPNGYQYGAYNQLCKQPLIGINNKCIYNTETLQDISGIIDCSQSYDCCMCRTIECGFNRLPCTALRIIGDYGAFGVREMYIAGSQSNTLTGATIDCQGSFACENSFISGTNIANMACDGNGACLNAHVIIINPKNNFVLDCAGVSSCEGLFIMIQLPETRGVCHSSDIFTISKINCNAEKACERLEIMITNNGCDRVVITDLECIQPDSCNNAIFNFYGDIAIQNLHCGPSCATSIGLESYLAKNVNLANYLCSNIHECAQQREIIENPRNGFEFICSATEACKDSQFIIQLNNKPNKLDIIDYFSGILISGDYSAQGVIFTIQNTQGIIVTVNKIECNGYRSCEFATFITGKDVAIQEVICAPDACLNCYIKESVNSVGIPCDPKQITSIQLV